MPEETEPKPDKPHDPRRIGEYPSRLFVKLSNGTVIRRPTTMLRPPTHREAVLGRPATSHDIIGYDEVFRMADEQKELQKQFNHEDDYDSDNE